ncbi:MAG: START-like domain-containing protein [Saprospiraceae bacterium]|jgi:uncharacterized protein YndB with AHSA1/START domain
MERVKFTMEFIFRASPTILYQFLTTPACLIRWFCDEIDIQGETFTFMWNDTEEVAELVMDHEDELVKFKWEDAPSEEEYLEFKMYKSPVTGETILEVTDFCDDDEVEDQKQYWVSQLEKLRKESGS